jgi:NAD-dependent SIR2 family protein deacetylase
MEPTASQADGVQSEPTVYLLGAGFSACATNGELPVMAGFFDWLTPQKYPLLREFVEDVTADVDRANIEEVIEILDQLQDAPLSDLGGKIKKWQPQVHELRRHLARYCLDRLGHGKWSADHWSSCVLATADSATTVITTNYDNVAESILSHKVGATHCGDQPTCHHCRMRRILLRDCECSEAPAKNWPHWRGSVLKLHGSIAWKTCYNPGCRQYQCLVADQHCRPYEDCRCSCCGELCQPVIVLPSHRKSYREYPHLNRMWDSAADAMREAASLLVFGFSFSSGESLVRLMVREAIVNGVLKQISILDRDPAAVAARLRQIIPSNHSLEILEFAIPMDGSRPRWISDTEFDVSGVAKTEKT